MNLRRACQRPVTDSRRLAVELYCLLLVFIPHRHNNTTRKLATLVVVATWAILEILNAVPAFAGEVILPKEFFLLRLFVGIVIGRMWGIQFNSIADYSISNDNDGDD